MREPCGFSENSLPSFASISIDRNQGRFEFFTCTTRCEAVGVIDCSDGILGVNKWAVCYAPAVQTRIATCLGPFSRGQMSKSSDAPTLAKMLVNSGRRKHSRTQLNP